MRLFFCILLAFTANFSSLLHKSRARGASIEGGVTDVHRWEYKDVYVETTVSPVWTADQSLTTSAASPSAPTTIQETLTTSSPASVQDDGKHTGPTSETATSGRQNPVVATQPEENVWTMSTLSENIEHTSLALSDGTTSSTQSEIVTEDGQTKAMSIAKVLRSSGSFEEFSSSCSGTDKRLCGCSASCVIVDNCCYDSDFLESPADNSRRFSCYSEINEKWTLASPSRLINRCSSNWTDETLRDLCENPTGNDLKTYIPCYSPITRLSYRSIYCLHCNGLSENSLWEVTFQSARPYQFSFVDTFAELNNSAGRPFRLRGQLFVLSPQTGFEPSHCSFAVNECHPEFTTEILSKMCRAYYNPVLIKGTMYRNVHCLQCATGMSIEDVSPEQLVRRRQNPMSLLLDMRFDQKHGTCPAAGCLPEITRIRGYLQTFSAAVSFTTIANISSLDRQELFDLNNRWTYEPIHMFVNANLREYKHTVHCTARNPYALENIKEVKITLVIEDEISIGSIPAIEQQVLSMHFESNVDDLAHISCCLNVQVLGSGQNANLKPGQIRTDSTCAEGPCNDNNAAISLAVNSAQVTSRVGSVWLLLMVFTYGLLVTSYHK